MYQPEAFAVMGLFAATVAIFTIFGNAGYELAIMLPKKEEDAQSLVVFSIFTSILVSILSIFSYWFIQYFNLINTAYLPVFVLLPFAVFFESVSQALKVLLNKQKKYDSISKTRFWQAAFVAIFSIGLAYIYQSYWGLIVGLFIGYLVKFIGFIYSSKILSFPKSSTNIQRIKLNVKSYNKFFKFGLWGTGLNTISRQLPFFLLPFYFGENFAGQFTMALKILMLPIGLVSVAVGDVFFEKATKAFQTGLSELRKITFSSFKYLALISILMLVIGIPLSPFAFQFVLGDKWLEAGHLAQYLLPWTALMFVSSPLSYLIDVRQKLKFQLFFNCILFTFRLSVLVLIAQYFTSFNTIQAFGLGSAFLVGCYLIYLLRLGNVWGNSKLK